MRKAPILLYLTCWLLVSSFYCQKKHDEPKYETKSVSIQPGPDQGEDCLVAFRDSDNNLYATSNHKPTTDFTAIRWTYSEFGQGTNRSYIKFKALSDIPTDAEVISAKLSLYGVESGVAAGLGNSYYPGSPYANYELGAGSNACWLKRVTADWDDDTITWLNKPGTTDDDQATVSKSTSRWNYDALDIDVTGMVKKMVKESKNYGFCLQLKEEEIYRAILFGSSESPAEKRPKLVVEYKVRVND